MGNKTQLINDIIILSHFFSASYVPHLKQVLFEPRNGSAQNLRFLRVLQNNNKQPKNAKN